MITEVCDELKTLLLMSERLSAKLAVVEPQGSAEMSLLIRKHELDKRIDDLFYYRKILDNY